MKFSQDYLDDIKNSCKKVNATYQGSHGFRWTFAQNRVREYQYDYFLSGFNYMSEVRYEE